MERLPRTPEIPAYIGRVSLLARRIPAHTQFGSRRIPVVYRSDRSSLYINGLRPYIGVIHALSNNDQAGSDVVCARHRRTSVRMERRAPKVRLVWMKKLRMESDGRFRSAHRHGPGRPLPQGVGARAAIERDDRTAISERVPCGLPRTRGNRSRGAVQARGDILHTLRIPEAVQGSHVPGTQEERTHIPPTATGSGTHVPALLEEEHRAWRAGARATASHVPAQACGMRMHVPGQQRRWM